MDEVEKFKAVNANLEQRKQELVKELEQVDKHWTLERLKSDILWNNWALLSTQAVKIKLERLERLITPINYVTKFSPELSLTLYYFYTKISSFTLALSKGIVLDSFYGLIFCSEKFSISIWRLPFAVNVTLIERLRFTFPPNGKREVVPRDQVFPLIVVYCFLLLHRNKWFHASFIHKKCCGQFVSAYFLFWEILNLNLTFAVCRLPWTWILISLISLINQAWSGDWRRPNAMPCCCDRWNPAGRRPVY